MLCLLSKVFSVNNVNVVIRTRTEHLTDEEKARIKGIVCASIGICTFKEVEMIKRVVLWMWCWGRIVDFFSSVSLKTTARKNCLDAPC